MAHNSQPIVLLLLLLRSRVWSEPSVIDAAAYEFAETAKFLEAGEGLCSEG